MRKYAALFASRASGSLIQAVLFFSVARDSGPRTFGGISIVIAATIFVSVVAEFGMGTYLSRVCALNDPPRIRAILRVNSIATVILSTAIATSTLAATLTQIWTNALAFGLIALASPLDRYVETTLAIPVAAGRMTPVAISLGIRRLVALACYLSLPLHDAPLRFGLALLGGQLLAVLYSEFFVVRYARKFDSHISIRDVIRSAFPYFVSTISSQFRLLDSLLVGLVAGSFAAGIYSAADKLTRPVFLVSQTLTTLILPRSSRIPAYEARRDAHRLYLVACVGFVVLLPAIVWAEPLVQATLGGEFLDAVTPLRILLAAFPLIAASAPLGSLLQGQGEEKYVSRNSAVFAVLVVTSVILGAAVAGPVGAAAALAFASSVCTVSLAIRVEAL